MYRIKDTQIAHPTCFAYQHLTVVERISAQWAGTAAARLKPLEQTSTVERISASTAALIGHLPIRPNDTITDSTFSLPLQSSLNVPPPRAQCINEGTIKDSNRTQTSSEPALPLLLINSNAIQTLNVRIREREGRWQTNAHAHRLFIKDIARSDLAGARRNTNSEGVVCSRTSPVRHAIKRRGDDRR
jgi:hypothetical protein